MNPPPRARWPQSRRSFLHSTAGAAVLGALGGLGVPGLGRAQVPLLAWNGLFYGSPVVANGHGETNMTVSTASGVSQFFYGPRTGTVTRFRFNRRAGSGYSAGTGGTYTVEIRNADASTKLPITTGSPICQLTGYAPGVSGGAPASFPVVNFTLTGQLTFGQPYCVIFRNTHSNPSGNYISMNNIVHYVFNNDASGGPPPSGMPGSWTPVVVDGKDWYPFPIVARNRILRYRRIGPPILDLGWSDGAWTGPGLVSGFGGTNSRISGSNHFRERFRVTRANRTVRGVWIKIVRLNATSGNVIIRLERGPSSDTSGNGTIVEQRSFAASHVPNVGASEAWNEVQHSPPFEKLPWIFFQFNSNRTLSRGTTYNLRISSICTTFISTAQRAEHSNARWSPLSSTWAQHEANRQLPIDSFEDSRGVMTSTNGGSSWSFLGGNNREQAPVLFECVT
jgi:hypothetical protein